MGKFKVSFTTALFVFSFLVCVIVAVVFVDRRPGNDYDAFYDGEEAGDSEQIDRKREDNASGTSADEWEKRRQGRTKAEAAATPASEDPSLADLPLDPHLAGAAQPVPFNAGTPAAAQATANPHAGKSPEQIAREMMARTGGMPMPQQTQAIPGMAVPGGIPTPAQQAVATATPQTAMPQTNSYVPVQSNVPGGTLGNTGSAFPSPGGFSGSYNSNSPTGVTAPPSLSGSTNSGSGWDTLTGKPTPSNMIGVRGASGASDAGMMISRGKTEAGAEAPLGFEPQITNHGAVPAPGSTAASGQTGAQAPLLFAPGATPASVPGADKWDLPPAPTLRPPPIQDPDQRRSDAESPEAGAESPDSANPDGSSGQALAVSGPDGEAAVDAEADVETVEPDAIAARVNELELTEDQATRLARVAAKLKDETVTTENRQEKMTEAVREWTSVAAAAEEARKQELTVTPTEVEQYAAKKPDFDVETWKKGMAEVGFTKAEIESQLSAIALTEKLVEAELEKKYPETKLKQIYEKSPKEFYSPRQVHVMEIFKAKPEDEKQAKRVAGEMSRLQRQAAGGTDFGLLARQTSEAPSKSKGGDLGWKTPEDKDTQLGKAVTDLKPGQVSSVIEGEDGYRIYKLVAEKEARDDFEGAKELVVEKLKKEVRETALADAREEQDVELAPKKEIKVAKGEAEDEKKTTAKDTQSGKGARKTESEASKPKTAAIPQKPIQQAAANGQLLFAPGSQVEQRAGGAPAPAYQPGGQPPMQQSVAPAAEQPSGRGYSPGETIVVGGDNPAPPAAAIQPAAQNYAAPVAAGVVATPIANLTPEMQAAQLRAMQEMAQQEEQQRSAALEAQMQAARAQAARQAQAQEQSQGLGGEIMSQQQNLAQPTDRHGAYPAAQANAESAQSQPVTMHSNGWAVTRRDSKPEEKEAADRQSRSHRPSAAASGPTTIPPGFEGSDARAAAAQQQPAQQQAVEEPQREGGLLGGVKSLFSRNR